jgi:hypothetical protein
MKRICFISLFAILFSFYSFSQTDKGWRSVGGTGNLNLNFKNNSYTFGLNPEIYWFVANSFALGTDFGAGFYSIKTSDSTSSSSFNVYVTPGFRFYFRDPEKKWRPYVFGNGGFEAVSSHSKFANATTNSSSFGFRGYAGVGEAWFFSDHAAFDIRLHLIDYTLGSAAFNPNFSIGIQAFFHHE